MNRTVNIPPHIIWQVQNGSRMITTGSGKYKDLHRQLFIDFEQQFGIEISIRTPRFTLTQEQVIFLLTGLEQRLDKLIQSYAPVSLALNEIFVEYSGIEYKLCVAMSAEHNLIYQLLSFRELLSDSIKCKKKVTCHGKKNAQAY